MTPKKRNPTERRDLAKERRAQERRDSDRRAQPRRRGARRKDFCPTCGTELTSQLYCSVCKARVVKIRGDESV
jgi:hypothetical protein